MAPGDPPNNPPGPERAGRPTRRTATARTQRTAKTRAGEVHRTQGDKIWKGLVWWKGTELKFCVSFSEFFDIFLVEVSNRRADKQVIPAGLMHGGELELMDLGLG